MREREKEREREAHAKAERTRERERERESRREREREHLAAHWPLAGHCQLYCLALCVTFFCCNFGSLTGIVLAVVHICTHQSVDIFPPFWS